MRRVKRGADVAAAESRSAAAESRSAPRALYDPVNTALAGGLDGQLGTDDDEEIAGVTRRSAVASVSPDTVAPGRMPEPQMNLLHGTGEHPDRPYTKHVLPNPRFGGELGSCTTARAARCGCEPLITRHAVTAASTATGTIAISTILRMVDADCPLRDRGAQYPAATLEERP